MCSERATKKSIYAGERKQTEKNYARLFSSKFYQHIFHKWGKNEVN